MASRGIRRVGQLATHKTGSAPVDRAIGKVTDKVNEILANSISDAVLIEADLVLREAVRREGAESAFTTRCFWTTGGLGRAPLDFFWNTNRPGTVLSNAQADNPAPETTLWIVMASDFDACHAHLMVF